MDCTPPNSFTSLLNSSSFPMETPENCSQPEYSFDRPSQYDSESYRYAYNGSHSHYSRRGNTQSTFVGGEGDEPDREDGHINNDEAKRVGRRLTWTEEDNIHLTSAWLNNSVDPIDGNSKRGDVYWKQIAKEYNENSPVDRRRKAIRCKDHWGKTNRNIVQFNGIWCRLMDVYVSGQSDDQLMDKARAMYKSETNQCFNLVYLWRLVRNQPKWTRNYVEEGDNNTDNNDTLERNIAEERCPPDTKAAKAKVKGKGTIQSSVVNLSHDDIQLYYDTNALRASTADKMGDVQFQVSIYKIEAAKARERAAMAKNEKAIMDKYTELLMTDTTCFTDSHKTEHEIALQFFRGKLFGANYN